MSLVSRFQHVWRAITAFGGQPQAASSPAPAPLPQIAGAAIGSCWRHVKTGNDYTVIGGCVIERDRAPAVLYRDAAGTVWARPVSEFLDGRFVLLATA